MRSLLPFLGACTLVVAAGRLASGQEPYPTAPPPTPLSETPQAVVTVGAPTGLSDWITMGGTRGICCMGPFGSDPDIQTELYLRVGPDFPFGGGILARVLNTGWTIQGGGRALFFDPSFMRAWVADLSLSHSFTDAGDRALVDRPTVANQLVTVRQLNRTNVNLAFGRQWWLTVAADQPGNKWRAGVDIGGRWGSANVEFVEINHRTDVIGGAFVGAYSDFEFRLRDCLACSCFADSRCIFQAGVRVEYGYTWTDVLERASDVQDINVLFSFGVRY